MDASALIALTVSADARARVLERLGDDDRWSGLDFTPVECANALWKHTRFGTVPAEGAAEMLDSIARLDIDYHESGPLLPAALLLAIDLGHPVYDCAYVALALAEGARLVTCDRRLADVAARAGLAGRVVLVELRAPRETRPARRRGRGEPPAD